MAKKKSKKTPDKSSRESAILIPPKLMAQFAEEVAKTVVSHLPHPRQRKKTERIENAVFLDTSAIIDGREA